MFHAICNYVAENDEALNLVEGEKLYVIERHNSEWWFVKKTISDEHGWVPSQYLMEPVEYTQYVQKKLHEKIDKLPVFERKLIHYVVNVCGCLTFPLFCEIFV